MLSVTHNPSQQRFELALDGALAICTYRKPYDNVWELNHTYVPSELRGRGVAAQLAKAALEHIQAQEAKVLPSCSYIATYIERHPSFQALLYTA